MVKLNRFKTVSGAYVEEIIGQSRLGYSLSDTTDFYDMPELLEHGNYCGSIILFYDYDNGMIYKPFDRHPNVLYGRPVYIQNYYWFLQGYFNEKKMNLFRYRPEGSPELITQLNIADINLYNLRIIGEDVHITSEDDEFICYYPQQFHFLKDPKERVEMIADGKIYLSAWVEEGWDHENNRPSENYRYYNKVIVRDCSGRILSEEVGSLQQRVDGTWWIS